MQYSSSSWVVLVIVWMFYIVIASWAWVIIKTLIILLIMIILFSVLNEGQLLSDDNVYFISVRELIVLHIKGSWLDKIGSELN